MLGYLLSNNGSLKKKQKKQKIYIVQELAKQSAWAIIAVECPWCFIFMMDARTGSQNLDQPSWTPMLTSIGPGDNSKGGDGAGVTE